MSTVVTKNNSNETRRRGKTRAVVILVLTVLLTIAITVGLFLFRDKVEALGNYGYLGAFLVGLITSATVVLPMPGVVVLFALAATLNPVLVGLAGATGAILGEITGFIVGHEGHELAPHRNKIYLKLEEWMKRWGDWAVFAIASVPLPLFDVAGMIAGALRYPLWKFLLIGWVGKIIKYFLLVMAGRWGWEALLNFIGRPPTGVP